MTPIYNSTIPKQYSTYTVTIASFSYPPCEATLAARDPYFPPGIPFKLFGNIYLIIYMSMKQRFWRSTAQYGIRIYFNTVISTPSGHPWSPAPTIYFNAVISTLERHGTATVGEARAPQVQGPSAMFFLFFVFCFYSHGRFEQGLKWSKQPHQLPYWLNPHSATVQKTLCHPEQILNNREIIHHLVLATE